MPILIRIILQRLLILIYSFLAFLGIAPEASIPTEEEAIIAIEERQQAITDFFNEKEIKKTIDKTVEIGKDIAKEIELDTNTIEKPTTNYSPDDIFDDSEEVVNQNDQAEETPIKQSSSSKEDVIVNIVCSQDNLSFINVSTGSGVIIDPKGIILTNAHVGQFVLIEDQQKNSSMRCAAYKENIPTFGYELDVLYISPDWIEENYNLINSKNPKGTGEFDYALLYITGSTNPAIRKPRNIPYADIYLNEFIYKEDQEVVVAGYPGIPQNIIDVARAGTLKIDNVLIKDVFTFNTRTIDIISTTKTEVGARGASGGGVFVNGNLIGVISTTNGEQNNANINAITTTYINRNIKENTGETIKELLAKDHIETILKFSEEYGINLSNLLFNQM